MWLTESVRSWLTGFRRRKARRRAVQDFRRSLALIVDLDSLESSVASRLKELFDPDVLVILQLDRQTSLYLPTFTFGVDKEQLQEYRIRPKGRLSRWFLVNEICLVVPRDRGVLAYIDPEEQELLRRLDIQLCAPLLARNHLAGMLMLGRRRAQWKPSRQDSNLLLNLSNQVSLAFQNAALYSEQQERLEALHRADRLAAVGALAAGVAHEVGNPLTSIRSTMQFLVQRSPEDDSSRDLLQDLIGEVDRISKTVSSLLGLTRSGELKQAEVDLVALVSQTLQLLEFQARKQNVTFETRFSQPSVRITADANRLKQVFLNLVLNSLQAMPEGGLVMIEIELLSDPRRRRPSARIKLRDSGAGISKEHLQRIFDPFFTTKSDGTGLGLAICRSIVQRHEGTLDIESTTGKGTTVIVDLPVRFSGGER